MKTQRRWLKSVIAAANDDITMPWAARRAANQGEVAATKVAPSQPIAANAARSYAIAAR